LVFRFAPLGVASRNIFINLNFELSFLILIFKFYIMDGTGGFINPEKILLQVGLKEGTTLADFGCGHGYFTVPAGKIIGKEGKIYAVDILGESLEAVDSRARLEGVVNILTKRGNLEVLGGSGVKDEAVDVVLLHNVLFQSQKKSDILKEASRVLKPSGTLVVIDWLPVFEATGESAVFGPQGGWRISAQEAKRLVGEEGFSFDRSMDAGEYHYGLIFTKA